MSSIKAAENCSYCAGVGWLGLDLKVGDPDFGELVPCQCIQGQLEHNRMDKGLGDCGLSPRQRVMVFGTFDPRRGVPLVMPDPLDKSYEADRVRLRHRKLRDLRGGLVQHLSQAKAICRDYAERPSGFLTLMGEPGCGKTHLVAAIANYRLARGLAVHLALVPDLLDHLRATFSPDTTVQYDVRFEAYKSSPLLILDDLGTEKGTEWGREKLYQLVDHRYNWNLPMVITTNEVPTHLDGRLISRLFDRRDNRLFEILAGDYRLKSKQEKEKGIRDVG